jgi:UPF0755 protein
MLLNRQRKIIIAFFVVIVAFLATEFYLPKSFNQPTKAVFLVQKGMNSKEIAIALQKQGLIKSDWFFRLYVIIFNQRTKLQAGRYDLSSSMSIATIAQKIALGETIKNTVTIVEGWDVQDMAEYLADKKIYTTNDFIGATKSSSKYFDFLQDKPNSVSLEGYLFPDTYEISGSETSQELVLDMLNNFDRKLTPDLRAEIKKQKKTIFQIVTMASILEKEVKALDDKKIVAGILWKRIAEGMPLQVDATINYITRKDHAGALIADTKIDSPYNTYKYYGLPKGPISSPGLDSLRAAIYPTKTDYWFYLSASKTGKTIFSKTLDEHNRAAQKYLK